MNAHQSEHVGQRHDTGPDTADGLVPGRYKLNHTGHRYEITAAVRGTDLIRLGVILKAFVYNLKAARKAAFYLPEVRF